MSTALHPPMSLDAFLAWENRQELRYEFDGFAPLGRPCQAFGSELKIAVAGSIRYPDAFVVCMPIMPGSLVVEDPVVIFEILSPSTAATDRIVKNREYRATQSVQRCVLLEQVRPAATVFTRDGTDWIGRILDADAGLAMPEIGIELPLAELYEGIAFPDLIEDD